MGPSSLTRDRTQAPCIGSVESYPVDHQRSPGKGILTRRQAIANPDPGFEERVLDRARERIWASLPA